MKAVEALVKYPEKGSDPEELVALGIKEYRQTTFKPYRVIYLVVDGCRDMQSLLACRLLGA